MHADFCCLLQMEIKYYNTLLRRLLITCGHVGHKKVGKNAEEVPHNQLFS